MNHVAFSLSGSWKGTILFGILLAWVGWSSARAESIVTYRLPGGSIYRLSLGSGGGPEDVGAALEAKWPGGGDEWLNLSPDGAWLLFSTERFDPDCTGWPCLAVAASDLSSGAAIRSPSGVLHAEGFSAIANSGAMVVYSAPGTSHAQDLWVVGKTADSWGDPVLLTGGTPYNYNEVPALSDDGTRVLFDCGQQPYGVTGTAICEIGTDGTGFRVVFKPEQGPGGTTANAIHSADYAPDGSIVFEADWAGEQIWRLPAGSTTPSLVASQFGNDNSPCVLPDGRIASLWLDRPGAAGAHELKIMAPDGSGYSLPLAPDLDLFDVGMGCGGTAAPTPTPTATPGFPTPSPTASPTPAPTSGPSPTPTVFLPSAPPAGWDPRGISGGGSIFSPGFRPGAPGEIWVASDMGEWLRSRDGGASWMTVSYRKIVGGRSFSPVQFGSDPDVLYALDRREIDHAEASTPARSADGGTTWSPVANPCEDALCYTLFADPGRTDRLVVSDWSRLYFSGDSGASFQEKFFTASGNGLLVAGAFFDGETIYVGTSVGLLRSTDGGGSFSLWSVAGIPAGKAMISFAGGRQNETVRLACGTFDSGNVYPNPATESDYWGQNGIYVLEATATAPVWQAAAGIAATDFPFLVAMSPSDATTIYAAGGSEGSVPVVYRSTDSGASWQKVLETAGNQNVQTGYCGEGGDYNWYFAEVPFGLAVAPDDASRVIFTDFGFAHQTTDGGLTWQALYVPPSERNLASAQTPQGKSYTSNGLNVTTVWDLTWIDSTMLVAAYTDIHGVRSTDEGLSWSFDGTDPGQDLYDNVYRVVRAPSTGRLYAAISDIHDIYQTTRLEDADLDVGGGAIAWSDDNGATWSILHDFGHPAVWVETDPANPNRLYASVVHSTEGGIWVTDDLQQGTAASWRKLADPPRTTGHGHPDILRALQDGTLVATWSAHRDDGLTNIFHDSSGLFVSTDGGATWEDRSHPDMRYYTKDVILDPHDASQKSWYVAVWSGWGPVASGKGGLFRTTDRGATWSRISDIFRVESATISPWSPEEMYVTTETDGLWRTTNLQTSAPSFVPVDSYPFFHPLRVFFDPYEPARVWVTSFGNGLATGLSGTAVGAFFLPPWALLLLPPAMILWRRRRASDGLGSRKRPSSP